MIKTNACSSAGLTDGTIERRWRGGEEEGEEGGSWSCHNDDGL